MEPFENTEDLDFLLEPETPEESIPEPVSQPEQPARPEPQPEPYAYVPPKKRSPYADSPYEMPRFEPGFTAQPQKPKRQKVKKPGRGKRILAALLAITLIGGGVFGAAMYTAEQNRKIAALESQIDKLTQQYRALEEQKQQGSHAVIVPTDGSAMTPAQLYSGNVDSVVAISTTVQTNSYYGPSSGTSAGSGFILTEDGYVITNYHVVEDATKIEVHTYAGQDYDAALVGHDATNDLAVLKVEATGLPAAALGSSNDLVIGDMVVAIGNPLGELSATQTVGYVSGIDREVSTDNLTTISMIQTDAAINPGNSGGPLFNMYGQVIGITTAKYSGTTGSGATIEGIGFAIPIDDVVPLIDDLIDYGYVTGAYMGVSVSNTDEASAAMFGLPTGAYIMGVDEGGAADRAGIREKDIIITLDEHTITNVTDLTRALRGYSAGDSAQVTVLRGGKEVTLTIVLDERPQETAPAEAAPQQSPSTPMPGTFDDLFDFFEDFFG